MTQVVCDYCDTTFAPSKAEGEVRCPKCGAFHDLRPAAIPSLKDKTELAFTPSEDRTVVEPVTLSPEVPPGRTGRDPNHAEGFYAQPTHAAVENTLSPLKDPRVREYIPTLVLCGVFLLWVGYDKLIRTPRFEGALTRAVQALRTGDRVQANREARKAVHIRPRSELAQEIEEFTAK